MMKGPRQAALAGGTVLSALMKGSMFKISHGTDSMSQASRIEMASALHHVVLHKEGLHDKEPDDWLDHIEVFVAVLSSNDPGEWFTVGGMKATCRYLK